MLPPKMTPHCLLCLLMGSILLRNQFSAFNKAQGEHNRIQGGRPCVHKTQLMHTTLIWDRSMVLLIYSCPTGCGEDITCQE